MGMHTGYAFTYAGGNSKAWHAQIILTLIVDMVKISWQPLS